jgi:hypothetical protein
MRPSTPLRLRLCIASLALTGLAAASASAGDLVELTLVAEAGRFSPANPRREVRKEFTLPGPGVLTILYTADPWPENATLGGEGIAMKDGSRMPSMRNAVGIRESVGGARSTTTVVLVYAPVPKPLEATLTALGSGDAAHIQNQGTQYATQQRLTIRFAPMGQAVGAGGSASALDLSGVWRYDRGSGQTLTFTRRSNGLYDVVEEGYGFGRGTASVAGRIVTYEYENSQAFGSQKRGTYVLEVAPGGETMAGAWMTDNQEHGDTWLTRTTPAPAPAPPAPTEPEPASPGPSKPQPESSSPSPVPEPASTNRFTVQAGVRRVKSGETVQVPLYLLNPGGAANVNVTVAYSPSVARAEGKVVRGNALGAALFEANAAETGVVRVGFASSTGLVDSGTLAHIPFVATGRPGDRTVLSVKVTTAHTAAGARAVAETIDGTVIVVGPDGLVPGDADGDGVLSAADALSALKMSVKLVPERLVLDVDKDGAVTSHDARLILLATVGQ